MKQDFSRKERRIMNSIDDVLKATKIRRYMIAERIGISESTMSRMMRKPLSKEDETRVLRAVAEIQLERRIANGENYL